LRALRPVATAADLAPYDGAMIAERETRARTRPPRALDELASGG
jgi:hypothetical protein